MARVLNAVAAGLSGRLRRAGGLLRALGPVAGPLLRAGPLRLTGSMPNGQMFSMTPYRVWVATGSKATLAGRDLGTPGPLPEQARVGDFRIPQRGLIAVGSAYFTPLDPARHSTRLALSTGLGAIPPRAGSTAQPATASLSWRWRSVCCTTKLYRSAMDEFAQEEPATWAGGCSTSRTVLKALKAVAETLARQMTVSILQDASMSGPVQVLLLTGSSGPPVGASACTLAAS